MAYPEFYPYFASGFRFRKKAYVFKEVDLHDRVYDDGDDVGGDLPVLAGDELPDESMRHARVNPAPAVLVEVSIVPQHVERQRYDHY